MTLSEREQLGYIAAQAADARLNVELETEGMTLNIGHPPAQLWQCQHRSKLTPERCLTRLAKSESLWLILIKLAVDDEILFCIAYSYPI